VDAHDQGDAQHGAKLHPRQVAEDEIALRGLSGYRPGDPHQVILRRTQIAARIRLRAGCLGADRRSRAEEEKGDDRGGPFARAREPPGRVRHRQRPDQAGDFPDIPVVDRYRALGRRDLHRQREPGRITLNDGHPCRRQWLAEQLRSISFGLRGR
jgi:hypothetical protein